MAPGRSIDAYIEFWIAFSGIHLARNFKTTRDLYIGAKIYRRGTLLAFVYSITLFINAALLFIIEPMVAKMILPFLGGSPAVWNTSLVFYQACLLAGYAYAHFGSTWLGTRRHALVHLNLLFAGLLLLPIVLPLDWLGAPSENPVNLVLGVLAVSIGFPFLILSAGAPLLQKWFAQSRHGAARDPYFLYAASNSGSLAGLLAYPFLLEPRLPLSQQNHFWFIGYLVLLALVALCVLYFLRPMTGRFDEKSPPLADENRSASEAADPTLARRLRWILWGFVPSSLLLGVTSYVTTDIGSAPFLWVLPLAAYLMSFILAFARSSWMTHPILLRAQAFFLVGIAATVFLHANEPDEILLPLHLIGFFITALVCHGRLAQDRPSAKHLTDYFLWLSFGGVLGGAFNALLAPTLFKHVIEYPLVIALAGLIRPQQGVQDESKRNRQFDWLLPPAVIALIVCTTLALKQIQILPTVNDRSLIGGLSALFLLSVGLRPVRFGIGLVLLALVSLWYPSPFGKVLYTGRSFFGAYRAATDSDGTRNVLFQGTTLHGTQSVDRQTKLMPLAYYHRTGPAGQVLLANAARHGSDRIAVVGLGTGSLACYGTAKQVFTFYEIDPLVEKIARDAGLFTFLRDCSPRIDVVIGDARLSLAKTPNRVYDLFVLDAFSSDVIPVHLLTRQALELYLQKITPTGVLLFHVSNRYMDLAPVLDRLAVELNLAAFIQNDFDISAEEQAEGKSPSRWILMARDRRVAASYLADGRWRQLNGQLGGDLWTDDYSDLLKVIHWR